jgi:hypothetical protein
VGAIFGGALGLDVQPMDSPLWVLDGYGDPMITSGYDILVELQAYNLETSAVDTIRFGTDAYNDPSAPGYFSPRMIQSLNFRRDMFTGNTTAGAGRVSFGEMRIANDDGSLDMLRTTYAFAGWPAKLMIGDTTLTFDTFETLLTGKPLQVFFSFSDLVVSLRDRLEDLQDPIQTNNYKGDNILPNGLEGGEDLKDKPKPLLFGRVQNVSPILINTAKLIYQVNDGPVEYLPAVYDQGVPLTRDVDYATSAEMIATQPTPGTFRCWMQGGCFRIGAMPVGTITCDAADKYLLSGTEVDLGNTAAQVAVRILTHAGGISMSDINTQDVTHLDNINSATVGIWFSDQTTFGQGLDKILGSIGAWYGFDRFDQLRMKRHDVPTGGQGVCTFRMFGPGEGGDAALTDFDILDVRFLATNDPDRGVPAWEINVEYSLNYTVQQKDNLGGSVQLPRQTFLGLSVRTATASNEALKTPYPLAKTKTVTTVLLDATEAQNEANRLLAIYSAQRDFIEIDTPLSSELVATVDIGDQVFVVLPRFNYQLGKVFVVIGMQYNPGTRGLTLSLWG